METKKTKKADLESKRPLLLSIGMVLSLSLILLAFSWKTPVQEMDDFGQVQWDIPDDVIIPLTKPEKELLAPPVRTVMEFILVNDETEIEDEQLDIFDTEMTDEGIDVNALLEAHREDKFTDETVYFFVDEMPEFPGGMEALLRYIAKAVDYPMVAQENGIQGKVYINFVVNTNGQVSDATVVRGVDPSLDKEALRVVNSMPLWQPGRQSGKAVRVAYHVPISFVLQ
ncbi:energy transducer TonB [uncultured Sunxiuqinia sp.]|uniref:energy transducer TonB n=1 Tax=uncultured Sunxiuqinia sp. TaxID=1573825 RepID=UPI0030DBA8CA|tara:strand:+ start:9650 stop:10330 length:681 start_codon:yes stop_codon:yes gene_type:complete